jgi:O-6-methylguanine DNA methyltransferase
MKLWIDEFDSVLGTILLVSDGESVRALDYVEYRERMERLLRSHYGSFELHAACDPGGASAAIQAYLSGGLRALNEVPVATGGTAFQRRVWARLRQIPVGATTTYGELAREFGMSNGARAVGLANGSNPIAIIVPCHRVIGANGKLTGYAGGLERKQWLLAHEGARLWRPSDLGQEYLKAQIAISNTELI